MNRYLSVLILIWWAGAITASVALFLPVYENYLIAAFTGWITLTLATALILVEMKRIKREDKKKEELKG